MNIRHCLLFLASAFVVADNNYPGAVDTITTTQSPQPSTSYPPPSATMAYYTLTDANGVPYTTQARTYIQSFPPLKSVPAVPKSGSVGLGTISGKVGTVQSNRFVTITV